MTGAGKPLPPEGPGSGPAYREIAQPDIPDLFAVRVVTRENAMTLEELARFGVTEDSIREVLGASHRGWLCEVDGRVVAFAMGDRTNGEMTVIAVLPGHEEQGIGGELLNRVEDWLWSEGWKEIWLTTSEDTSLRAYGFYRRYGWVDWKIEGGNRYMKKARP